MLTDLQHAQDLLDSGNYTCVACRNDIIHTATERGVAPLLNWLDTGLNLTEFCAADRVVGRATAFLYVLLGVKSVYARVMSSPAAAVLKAYGIDAQTDLIVEGIINRQGNGPCPFESAVLGIEDASLALAAIRQKRMELRKDAKQ